MEEDNEVIREGILSVREFHFSLEDWQLSREAMLCQKAKGRGNFTKDDVMAIKEKYAEATEIKADEEYDTQDKKKQQKIAKKLAAEKKQLEKYQIETTRRYLNMVEMKYKEEKKRLRIEWAKILRENKLQEKEEQKRQRKMRKGKGKKDKENKNIDSNTGAENKVNEEECGDRTHMDKPFNTKNDIQNTAQSFLTGSMGDFRISDGIKDEHNTDLCKSTDRGDESHETNMYTNNVMSDESNSSSDDVETDSGKADKRVDGNNHLSDRKYDEGSANSTLPCNVDVDESLSVNDVNIDCSINEEFGSKAIVNNGTCPSEEDMTGNIKMASANTNTSVNEGFTPMADKTNGEFEESKENIKGLKMSKKDKNNRPGCLCGLFRRLLSGKRNNSKEYRHQPENVQNE